MRQIGVYDAKTQLAKLLDCVENGETIEITRHGKPVAHLVPLEKPRPDVQATIDAIIQARKKHKLNGLTVKELINEGRKY